jgi:hypothetical protein
MTRSTSVTVTDIQNRRAREETVKDAYYAARDALHEALQKAALVGPGRNTVAGLLFRRLFGAGCQWVGYWQRRCDKAERALRQLLASDLSDPQRAAATQALYGRRDATALSDAERALIAAYRNLDAASRQMLRTLVARLQPRGEQ